MSRLRFAMIGCGAVATGHQLPALAQSSRVDLVALVDRDEAWLAKVARRFDVPEAYTSHRALIGRVDAALVATPNTTHVEIACDLLEHGVHVLCEKPIATTRADMERMLDAAARGGARVMAAHCTRFSPNVAMLHDLLALGWFGSLVEVSAGLGGDYGMSEHRTNFRRERGLAGGGVLVDLGIHLIDVALWLCGAAPTAVGYSAAVAPGWEVETDAEVVLDFSDGSRAALASSYTHGLDNTLVVRGSEGWARLHLHSSTELTLFTPRARACNRAGMQRLLVPEESRYLRQVDHFCEAITSGDDFLVGADEVLAGIDVIERCYAGDGAHDGR